MMSERGSVKVVRTRVGNVLSSVNNIWKFSDGNHKLGLIVTTRHTHLIELFRTILGSYHYSRHDSGHVEYVGYFCPWCSELDLSSASIDVSRYSRKLRTFHVEN